MSGIISTITSKWQVTIPEDVRKELPLKIGQRIVWEVEGDKLVGRRVRSIVELSGCFKSASAPPKGKDTPGDFAKAALARHVHFQAEIMKEFLLDANVLVRFLVQDDPKHSAAATTLFEKAERREVALHLDALVVAETVYVLIGRYGRSRTEVVNVLLAIIQNAGIETVEKTVVTDALQRFAAFNVDFSDAWHRRPQRLTVRPVASVSTAISTSSKTSSDLSRAHRSEQSPRDRQRPQMVRLPIIFFLPVPIKQAIGGCKRDGKEIDANKSG